MEIRREIICIVSGHWDTVWFCQTENEIYYGKALFTAAVREFQVIRDSSGRECDKKYLWDAVVPVDPNSIGGDLSITDSHEYIGMVPAGSDPFDPAFALEFPPEAMRKSA